MLGLPCKILETFFDEGLNKRIECCTWLWSTESAHQQKDVLAQERMLQDCKT